MLVYLVELVPSVVLDSSSVPSTEIKEIKYEVGTTPVPCDIEYVNYPNLLKMVN